MTSKTSLRNATFLREMGVGPLWTRRDGVAAADESPVAPVVYDAPGIAQELDAASSAWHAQPDPVPRVEQLAQHASSNSEIAQMNWPQLQAAVAGCTKCGLCRTRKNTVFGVGDAKAKWLFIGEGPGRNEDLQGEPFVGPAGKLLDNMLRAIDLQRGSNAFIANVVKCRATDENGRDRAPTPDEAAACMPYLERQIELINPTVMVALGKTAALSLLKLDPSTAVSKLRGSTYRYADRPLVVTYHPAYLLRSLTEKRKSWADLCLATDIYAGISS